MNDNYVKFAEKQSVETKIEMLRSFTQASKVNIQLSTDHYLTIDHEYVFVHAHLDHFSFSRRPYCLAVFYIEHDSFMKIIL